MSTDHTIQPAAEMLANEPSTIWQRGKHISQLDGVRGLAILIVTLYRFSKDIPTDSWLGQAMHTVLAFGDRGVELFFVLSGFLITGILVDAKAKDGFFKNFFARRSLRIFPLYFFALFLFVVVMSWFPPFASMFAEGIDNQFYLWTYLANVKMSFDSAWSFGYLDHFWSLAVEEHFYLVWPFVIFSLSQKRALKVATVLAIGCAVSRIGFTALVDNGVAPNVLTIFRCDALLLGAIVALKIREDGGLKLPKWTIAIFMACLLLACAAHVLEKRLLSIPNSLWPIVWTFVLVWLLNSKSTSVMGRLFDIRGLRTLGKYSYAMYVFQLPLIPLTAGVVSIAGLTNLLGSPIAASICYIAIMFVLTYGAAIMSWHFIEKHCLKLKHFFGGNGTQANTSGSVRTASSLGSTIAAAQSHSH